MRLEHWWYTIPLRLRSMFRRAQTEQELDEELCIHLEQRIRQEIGLRQNAGRSPLRGVAGHGRNGTTQGGVPRYATNELH